MKRDFTGKPKPDPESGPSSTGAAHDPDICVVTGALSGVLANRNQ